MYSLNEALTLLDPDFKKTNDSKIHVAKVKDITLIKELTNGSTYYVYMETDYRDIGDIDNFIDRISHYISISFKLEVLENKDDRMWEVLYDLNRSNNKEKEARSSFAQHKNIRKLIEDNYLIKVIFANGGNRVITHRDGIIREAITTGNFYFYNSDWKIKLLELLSISPLQPKLLSAPYEIYDSLKSYISTNIARTIMKFLSNTIDMKTT